MIKLKLLFSILLFFLITSCSKDLERKSLINEKSLDAQVREAYESGLDALEEGDVLFAAKKFNEAEILFPQSIWAPKSSLMAAYAYYSQDYYGDAIAELERFIRIYPLDKNIDYAHYLLGVCFYEQIVDEKKDLQSITKSKEKFQYLIKEYPNTEYALDAEFKIELIDDLLAAKEIYLGRYYFERKKWIASINRFRTIIDEYDTTIYAEEALHRLVEVHYMLGLIDEAEKYAKLLGYNYQSSEWYENTYALFDKKYKINKKKLEKEKDNNDKSFIKKIKSLIK
ncbi:outer membrane protein assembly factor BamD [Candidatus Pelagibacter sp.]|nr:outer membrane protein assembly factor BamD [Candidatus Pelagibacter sp.]